MPATILFAEDDDMLRLVLAHVLETHGYDVIQVQSGSDALRVFQTRAAIDLVISDVSIPSRAAPRVLAALRHHAAPYPLMFVSGYPYPVASRLSALRPGARFLAKPFSSTQLLATVRELLATSAGAAAVPVSS